MTQIEVLAPTRNVRGGYKVDVSRGTRIGRVSSEWFNRPPDERFLSLTDLWNSVKSRSERSRTRVVESAAIRVEASRDNAERLALIMPGSDRPIEPTHWSFGQLAGLVGAPANYLRQLPAPLAGINLQYGLSEHRAEQVKTLEIEDARIELRAVTGPDYGRIHDHELVEAVQRIAGNGTGDTRWKVPGVLEWSTGVYNPTADITKETTTLYASDRDVFLFLVDDLNPIEAGKLPDGSPDLFFRLNVRPVLDEEGNETGIYRVPAGGRRFRALELLVKQKKLAKDEPVPCIVSNAATSEEEDSLAENLQRQALHPLDQFRAFQTLRDQGLDEEEIAARFFVSPATVKQRLRLASVSQKLLGLYADDEIKLEQVMAFSLSNDHARQEQVWETVSRSQVREPYYIKRLLTETAVRADDRRAIYVGADAYEEAGGIILRDLFDEDRGGWYQDPALLEQLVFERLKIDAEALKQEGWKWVDAAIDFPYGHTSGMRRIYGESREPSADELARHDAIKAEYDKLDAEYAEAEDYDEAVEDRLEKLGAELDTLADRPIVYEPDEVARAGVFVTLGADGRLRIERGFIRPEDEPVVDVEDGEPDEPRGDGDANGEPVSGIAVNGRPASGGGVEEEEDETIRPLPDRLVFDLTAQRTLALRNALAADPALAFTAALHAFVLQVFYRFTSHTCLELSLKSASFSQAEGLGETVWAKEIDERHQDWGRDLPKDEGELWEFLIGLDEASRQALFAHCVSLSLNAVMEPWNKRPRELAHADIIARALDFDMVSAGWVPTVDNYLGRVTKARILEAVREAKGEGSAERIGQLKKADMAREAARLLEGSNWLPKLLRQADATPVSADDQDAAEINEEATELPAYLAANAEAADTVEAAE